VTSTKQFTVTLKMKKAARRPVSSSILFTVADPSWIYREEDYKRMITVDNPNPVAELLSDS